MVQVFSHSLRKRRTLAAGRNGHLKIAATDKRWSVEVAVVGIIHGVGQRSSGARLFIDRSVYLFAIGSGNHQKISLRHSGAVFRAQVCEPALFSPELKTWSEPGRDYRQVSGGPENTFNFLLGDGPPPTTSTL